MASLPVAFLAPLVGVGVALFVVFPIAALQQVYQRRSKKNIQRHIPGPQPCRVNFNMEKAEEARRAQIKSLASKCDSQQPQAEVSTVGPLPAYEDIRAPTPPPPYHHLVQY